MADETEVPNNNPEAVERTDDIVVSKEDWIEKAIEREATPRTLREPKTDQEFIAKYSISESTYYYELRKKENQRKIVDLCFEQAKKRLPEVLKKLGEKAEEGNDTSIGQFMDYVAEAKKRIDVTTNDKEVNTFTDEQAKLIAQRLIGNNTSK